MLEGSPGRLMILERCMSEFHPHRDWCVKCQKGRMQRGCASGVRLGKHAGLFGRAALESTIWTKWRGFVYLRGTLAANRLPSLFQRSSGSMRVRNGCRGVVRAPPTRLVF
jgi:hypothetical protein